MIYEKKLYGHLKIGDTFALEMDSSIWIKDILGFSTWKMGTSEWFMKPRDTDKVIHIRRKRGKKSNSI